jgi:hypothetical protein
LSAARNRNYHEQDLGSAVAILVTGFGLKHSMAFIDTGCRAMQGQNIV